MWENRNGHVDDAQWSTVSNDKTTSMWCAQRQRKMKAQEAMWKPTCKRSNAKLDRQDGGNANGEVAKEKIVPRMSEIANRMSPMDGMSPKDAMFTGGYNQRS